MVWAGRGPQPESLRVTVTNCLLAVTGTTVLDGNAARRHHRWPMFSTTNRRRLTCVGIRCNQRNDPEQQTMNLADDFDTLEDVHGRLAGRKAEVGK